MKDQTNPAAIVRAESNLRLLANKINAGLKGAESATRGGLERYKNVGDDLIQAKEAVGHGNWLNWIESNLECSRQHAARYMRLSREWSNVASMLHLTDALAYLTTDEKIAKEPKDVPITVLLARKVEAVHTLFEEISATKGRAAWFPEFKERLEPLLDFSKGLPHMPSDLTFSLPPVLNTPEFIDLWQKWIQHRKEKRNRLTPTSAREQLRDLASWGLAKALEALKTAIRCGWTGVFEPGAHRNGEPRLIDEIKRQARAAQ